MPGGISFCPFSSIVVGSGSPGRGKPKVLSVVPVGTVTRDPEHSLAMEAYRCESARVVAVSMMPEITEEAARNGWMT